LSRPSDHIDTPAPSEAALAASPALSPREWLRWFWRQLTSMRTALMLLLLLAIAAVPGSIVPQRSSDPNGVTQYFDNNPTSAPILDSFQMFDVYTSAWFSSIYLLLFISLIGCVIPRTKHHMQALRADPPKTPANLSRLPAHLTREVDGVTAEAAIEAAHKITRGLRYRVRRYDRGSMLTISAERGYARETGNLIFHFALVGVLLTVGFGGGFGFAGQRVVVEGQGFTNSLLAYDSFNPGRFFDPSTLPPYSVSLDSFKVTYEQQNPNAIGQPLDYNASVTTQLRGGTPEQQNIKVNEPLRIADTDVYLLGNGYAPTITVRDPSGQVIFTDSTPFLPQDANLTSVGVVKLPDGLAQQIGMIGFFYPTVSAGHSGALFSMYPDLVDPELTFNVYAGDLGLNEGIARSVYALDTKDLTQLTGGKTGVESIELKPGESAELPNGLGSVTFDGVKRFASLDIHRDPTQGWVLVFALAALAGLLISLFIPRRRLWVTVTTLPSGAVQIETAGLARGDDPTLDSAVSSLDSAIATNLGLTS
jgi:cytochrome c biogenesis protein